MLIFQRYIFRELTAPVLLSILFFTFVMLLRQLLDMAELLLEARIGGEMFLELLFIMTVSLVVLTIPMAVLLGVLIGLSRLTSENEILAMRVSGTSLTRVFYPLIILGLLGSGGLMYAGFYFVPKIAKQLVDKETQIEFELLTQLEPRRNYDEFAPRGTGIYLYFDETGKPQPGDGPYILRMEKVAMRVVGEAGEFTGSREELKVLAPDGNAPIRVAPPLSPEIKHERGEQETLFFTSRGTIEGDLETYSLTIKLEQGTFIPLNRMIYEVNEQEKTREALQRESPERQVLASFDSIEKTIYPRQRGDDKEHLSPRLMSITDLWNNTSNAPEGPMWRSDRRNKLTGEWEDYLEARNEIFQRYSLPFALPAFILIAIPLALEFRVRAKSIAFLISMGLILLYYVMITWAGAIGMSNSPLALPAFFAPNILIGGIGLFLFWRLERQ